MKHVQQRQLLTVNKDSFENGAVLNNETGVAKLTAAVESQQIVSDQAHFSFHQARKVSLNYLDAEDGDYFFEYQPKSIQLKDTFGENSSNLVVVRFDDSSFAIAPQILDGLLTFEVTGKPGYQASSKILVADRRAPEQILYSLTLTIDNGSNWIAEELSSMDLQEVSSEELKGEGLIDPSGGGGSQGSLMMQSGDTQAQEPHVIYCFDGRDPVGSVTIARTNWIGGLVSIDVTGSANPAYDYDFGGNNDIVEVTSGPGVRAVVKLLVPAGSTPYTFQIFARQDPYEPGQNDSFGVAEAASETVTLAFTPGQIDLTGSASVNIDDMLEGVAVTADPSSTSELGVSIPAVSPYRYGEFHAKPSSGANTKLCTAIFWQVEIPDPNGTNDGNLAALGSDYTLQDELNDLLIPDPGSNPPPNVAQSNSRLLNQEADFIMEVKPIRDSVLEGAENVRARVFVPVIGQTTSYATVTITEDYADAKVEKDEEAGCSCSCTTCSDGNAVEISADSGSASVKAADGIVVVSTGDQNGLNPVIKVGIKLPSDKAVPTTVSAQIQVIAPRTNSSGDLVGLGRKVAAQASPNVTFAVPAGATPGSTLWFSMQADLTSQATSWDRAAGNAGSTGVTEKIVPLEVLTNVAFAGSTPANQTFSGWVGRASHAMRNQLASSIAPGVGQNIAFAGLDRLLVNQQILVPDAASGTPSGGKVKRENGAMLFRADGGQSWFKDGSQPSPDSQDSLSGTLLTDRYGNKKQFNAQGDLTQTIDAVGNVSNYAYFGDGGLSSITDSRGQITTVTRLGVGAVSLTNSSTNRTYDLSYAPTNGTLTISYNDPDGTGPRARRQDVFTYVGGFLSELKTGAVGGPTHSTLFGHNDGFQGDKRLRSVTYPDGSSVTIELFRQSNRLVPSSYASGTIPANAINAMLIDPIGSSSTLPNYASVVYRRPGIADPQRTIVQLDHRGRVLRSWDAQQVFAMGLGAASLTWDSVAMQTLQANLDLSTEYTRKPTTRDSNGQITGQDYGEVLSVTTPDPDKIGGTNGPRGRQVTTFTTLNNNIVSRQLPIQNAESFVWNDTFDVLAEATDETGNKFFQTVNPVNGLVTSRKWEQQSSGSAWQNPDNPYDVNNDGQTTAVDVNWITSYLASNGGSTPVPNPAPPPPPYRDVNGDGLVSALDANLLIAFLSAPGVIPTAVSVPKLTMAEELISYTSTGTLPKGLITQRTTKTGRASGDSPTSYSYIDAPSIPAWHGKLQSTSVFNNGIPAITVYSYDARGNLISVLDPSGRLTKMWYDDLNRLIATMAPDPDGAGALLPVLTRYDYDVFGNIIATELINSRLEGPSLYLTALATGYSYDNGNKLTGIYTQNPNTQWYLTASGSTLIRSETKAASNVTVAMLETLASGNSAVPNSPASTSTLQGLRRTIDYFVASNEIQVTESNAGTNAQTTRYVFDRLDQVIKTVTPDPVNGYYPVVGEQLELGGLVSRFEYDNLRNPTKQTDALNNITTITYDDLNRPIKISEPHPTSPILTLDTLVTYGAQPQGWRVTKTDPTGGQIVSQLDMLGRTVRVSGDAPTQKIQYWTDGLLKRNTDDFGRSTNLDYDQRGRLASATNAVGATTAYTYYNDDLLQTVTDPLSRTTSYTYDAGGRLLRVTQPDPDGTGPGAPSYSEFIRDAVGNTIQTTDALNNLTTYSLDAWFRTLATTDAKGAVTSATYDVFGNTKTVTDPLGNLSQYTYNNLNQLVTDGKVVNGTALNRLYKYDAAGNTRELRDRNVRTTTWNYDNRYRVTAETWNTTPAYSYSYDNADRLTAVIDSNSQAVDYEFAYDARGQLQAERQSGSSLLNQSVGLDHNFDIFGNQTKLEANFGGTISGTTLTGGVWDFLQTYGYDNLNRLVSVKQNNSTGGNSVAPKSALYSYDAASQVTDLRRYSNLSFTALEVHTRNSYDGAGRLSSITHATSEIPVGLTWNGTSTLPTTSMLAGYFLTYDAGNRVTSLASQRDGFKTTYTYDTVNQLTAAATTQIPGLTMPFVPVAENYNLDLNGNRRTSAGVSQSASGTHNRLQTDGTYNYLYDNEGNVIRRTHKTTTAVTLYSWDHRNRLVTVSEMATAAAPVNKVTRYVYDAFDQRTAKQLDIGNNGVDRIEAYTWADGQEVLRWVDSDGVGAGAMRLANRYMWGRSVDELLSDEQYANNGFVVGSATALATAGNTLWALGDHLGSVRDLVDNNGIVRQHLVFDSFGRRIREVDYNTAGSPIASTDPAAVDELFGYTGRDWDSDVGLQYNRARWFDPNTGRWMSQDPIGFAAGDANLYRYVGNHPTYAADATGLQEPLVPQRWPNVHPSFPPEFTKHGLFPRIERDAWGLRTGLGKFEPRDFLGNSGFSMKDTSYGCGGIISMRVGLPKNSPMNVTQTKDAMAFGTLEDALAYLRDELKGNGAIVVLQRNWLRDANNDWIKNGYETMEHEKLTGRFKIPAIEVDPGPTCNFAILLGTEKDWFWEDATGPWRNPSNKVRHYQSSVTDEVEVVFIVIPNAASKSPIPKDLDK